MPGASKPATRNTRQRDAVRGAIERAGAPVSAQEILALAKKGSRGIGLATVYRTLKLLSDAGEIATVIIPGQAPRYEAAGKEHHHHFHCRECGKVYELEGCCGHFAELTPPGFELESHDVTLFGRCGECAAGQSGGRRIKA
ncbi:MAG: transcriptional repressor [Phycisphaerales bacterium]|jgi:Fur family ferric uptake transcriptional regulator